MCILFTRCLIGGSSDNVFFGTGREIFVFEMWKVDRGCRGDMGRGRPEICRGSGKGLQPLAGVGTSCPQGDSKIGIRLTVFIPFPSAAPAPFSLTFSQPSSSRVHGCAPCYGLSVSGGSEVLLGMHRSSIYTSVPLKSVARWDYASLQVM